MDPGELLPLLLLVVFNVLGTPVVRLDRTMQRVLCIPARHRTAPRASLGGFIHTGRGDEEEAEREGQSAFGFSKIPHGLIMAYC